MIEGRLRVIYLRLFITVALMSGFISSERAYDLSTKSVGFLGCGKISSAVAKGYAGKIQKEWNDIFYEKSEFKSTSHKLDIWRRMSIFKTSAYISVSPQRSQKQETSRGAPRHNWNCEVFPIIFHNYSIAFTHQAIGFWSCHESLYMQQVQMKSW